MLIKLNIVGNGGNVEAEVGGEERGQEARLGDRIIVARQV